MPREHDHAKLQGLRILVTRPQHQAHRFIALLEAAGAIAVKFPTIDIAYTKRESLSTDALNSALHSNFWIFTSVNAVAGAVACGLLPMSPHDFRVSTPAIAAIGQTTKQFLADQGITVNLVPPVNAGSERFLELFSGQFDETGKVTIFRGDSGRKELHDGLTALGAEVSYLNVYQRRLPDTSIDTAREKLRAAMPCMITVTSDLGLDNLLKLLPEELQARVFDSPLVVNSERCATLARDAGFINRVLVADPPGDEGQLQALEKLTQAC